MTAPLDGLRAALHAARHRGADGPLQPLADKGLAHHHVRLVGSALLARLPKQSQMGLDARQALAYEAACFERAAAGGHAPRLHAVLPPSAALPRGALLVDEVKGRPARLPQDLPALAAALASIHRLPLPEAGRRPPLRDDPDPLQALRAEIDAQAVHLDAAGLAADVRRAIQAHREDLRRRCEGSERPARRLVAFDAHPGNFLVRDDGRAILVDLEKARYSHPPLDLAHATLYTSTTWDLDSAAELTIDEVLATYRAWEDGVDPDVAMRRWLVPLRAAMWLWSVTWCAKWRVLSSAAARDADAGEDWSASHSSEALVAHVRDRVDTYLSTDGVGRVVAELQVLARRLAD